ncbi:MAG: RNA 2',3'-cyclic phosphodiesterase [Candidatus Kapaibacterium sp.]
MRTFISLNFNKGTMGLIKGYRDELRNMMDNDETEKIKWEAEDKYHITLFFIGDVKDGLKNIIIQKLDNIGNLNIGKIAFEFDKISAFPDLRNPRVLFLDVKDKEKKSFLLSKEVEDKMNMFGFEQRKKYVPHITLGRVRKNEGIQMMDINIECKGEKFMAENVCLMKSTLTSKGSYFEEVHRVEL